MKNLQKRNPERSQKYLDWVKSLPCAATGAPADDAHHGQDIGLGGGMKPSDFFTLPLTRTAHTVRHQKGHSYFSTTYCDDAEAILKTLDKALHDGVITIEVHL